MLQQGSIQEGFPWEVTCKLGRGHASTMWLEHGCAWRRALGGEARVQPAQSSYGSALCQNPAQSNPSEPQRWPLQLCPTSGLGTPLPLALYPVFWESCFAPLFSPRKGLPFTFHPACLSSTPLKRSPDPTHCLNPAHSLSGPWEPPLRPAGLFQSPGSRCRCRWSSLAEDTPGG